MGHRVYAAFLYLLLYSTHYRGVGVSSYVDAVTHDEVYVLVSVDIPHFTALCLADEKWIRLEIPHSTSNPTGNNLSSFFPELL